MKLSPANKKLVRELKTRLNELIEWTAMIVEERREFHPQRNGSLKPVAKYNKILSTVKKIFPDIEFLEIQWQEPPVDNFYDAECLNKCSEVWRESKALMKEVKYRESLSRCIDETSHTLDQARDFQSRINVAMQSKSWDEVIKQAQLCIEYSLKAIFKLVDLPSPRTHEIPMDLWDMLALRQKGKKIPKAATMEDVVQRFEDFEEHHRRDLAKLWWINSTWSPTHVTAAYGCLKVTPARLFEESDAKVVQSYAEEAYRKARRIFSLVQAGQLTVKKEALVKANE